MDRMGVRRQIAAEVRAEVARSGLSDREVADRAGIARSAYSAKRRGQRSFDAEELLAVANVVGVDPGRLLASAQLAA